MKCRQSNWEQIKRIERSVWLDWQRDANSANTREMADSKPISAINSLN